MTKEQVYDSRIAPLMSQIIAICHEHKIANVCSFSLDSEEGLLCTTLMVEDAFEPPDQFLECRSILIKPQPSPLMVTVEKSDGRKEIYAYL